MDRVFHARTAWYHYFLLVVLTLNTAGGLWTKHVLLTLFFALLLVVIIEHMVNTSYTVTGDGRLIIHLGRLSRKKIIPIKDIHSIRKCHSMKFGRFSVTNYLLIGYGEGKYTTVMPRKEQEFVEALARKHQQKPTIKSQE